LHYQILKGICKGTGFQKSMQGVKADTLTYLNVTCYLLLLCVKGINRGGSHELNRTKNIDTVKGNGKEKYVTITL
jgi:hypothetical protein